MWQDSDITDGSEIIDMEKDRISITLLWKTTRKPFQTLDGERSTEDDP